MPLHIKRRVLLDLRRQSAQVTIPFTKGDRVAHEVVFHIVDGGEVVELPPGTVAAIVIKNGVNGNGVVDWCSINHNDNTASYVPTEDALSVAGNIFCTLQLIDSDGASIGTPFFIFQIIDTDENETESEIKKALHASDSWGIIMETALNAEKASKSAVDAEAAKSAAESAAQSAESAAESATESAESAAESAMGSVPVMTELDKEMLRTWGGVVDGVRYENPDYFFSDINWQVLLRCNRAYVQAYDSDDEFRLRGKDGKGVYALKALIRYGGIGFTYDDGTEEGLRIDVMVPRYPWMKKTDWTGEGEPSWTDYPYMSTLCERRPDGRIRIPRTFSGLSNSEASQLCAPKDYVDTAVAAVVTAAKKEAIEACIPASGINPITNQTSAVVVNGSGKYVSIQVAANSAPASTVVQRDINGVVKTKTVGSSEDAVNVAYANSQYVGYSESLPNESNRFVYTRYGKTHKYVKLTKKPESDSTDTIPYRDADGRVRVGTPTYDKTADNDCAVPLSLFKSKLAALKAEILEELGG